MMFLGLVRASALPHPDDPIDPAKRAPITTNGAVQPSANTPRGDGVVPGGRLPAARAAVSGVPIAVGAAPIAVRESRPKVVNRPAVRSQPGPRSYLVKSPSGLPASIPRLDPQRYRKILAQYREGQQAAAAFTHRHVRRDRKAADMAAINRYAGPRATLEQQGIPVTSAGSAAEGSPPAPGAVPATASGASQGR